MNGMNGMPQASLLCMCQTLCVTMSSKAALLLLPAAPPPSCSGMPTATISNGAWPASCNGAAIDAQCAANCTYGGSASVTYLSTGLWGTTVTGSCNGEWGCCKCCLASWICSCDLACHWAQLSGEEESWNACYMLICLGTHKTPTWHSPLLCYHIVHHISINQSITRFS